MLLQSLLRPVLTPIMRGIFDPALCTNATGSAWSPLSLWPDGISSAGMWISPRTLTSEWQDYTGTTPVEEPGTVADSANPVGLALDIRAGATVLTDPGNHMLQSTSVDRPLLSARVNLLTYTEDFSNAIWIKRGAVSVTPNAITAPDGTLTADLISGIGATGVDDFYSVAPATPEATGASLSLSFYVDKGASSGVLDVQAVAGPGGGHWTISLSSVASGWDRITDAHPAVTVLVPFTVVSPAINSGPLFSASSGGPLSLYMWGCQLELASAASDYQAILGNGYPYSSTGFPIAQLYDGVDDGMATATFTAGTLIDGMDCMIVVRRDGNNQQSLGGLYQLDETKYFGVIGTDSGTSAGTHGGCGTPSIFVDNVAVSNTRGALYDAIGLGELHILEYRDLDMSAWVNAGFGYYASGYQLIGARGDILLYPSTASTEDKDAARQYLADYYGVTLP
jgi:hypothetical protein